jgi:hypothetical protein
MLDFWQKRASQWRPHLRRATTAATMFYFAKFRQVCGLASLTFQGGSGIFDGENDK